MCTTFLCYNLIKSLLRKRFFRTSLIDYPRLIRLNPNIPWKTRGNAALAIHLKTDLPSEKLYEICKSFVLKFATSPKANSGLVILEGEPVPQEIQNFSRRALSSVLGLREARKLIATFRMKSFSLRTQQGLVGALAGIGNLLAKDHTYELIAYKRNPLLPRDISRSKIITMSKNTFPDTFGSYDFDNNRVMIMPHGPDPVLCGIRGETARDVRRAFNMLRPVNNLKGWMIFRTNQGTGEHLNDAIELSDPKVYHSGKLVASITSKPKSEIGGHVFFKIGAHSSEVLCACYEPTGDFRSYAMRLILGDLIEVGGGVRKPTTSHPRVLNLEYFKPIKLAKKIKTANPRCPLCNRSLISRGKEQGFECPKCNFITRDTRKSEQLEKRNIRPRIYLPPVKAHRHLTKPIHRFSIQKEYHSRNLIQGWVN